MAQPSQIERTDRDTGRHLAIVILAGGIVLGAFAGWVLVAKAQPSGLYAFPPSEYPGISGPRLPLRHPPEHVPGCAAEPPISKWRGLLPLSRWFVGTWDALSLPMWAELPEPAEITRGDEVVLTLDETYYTAPADPSAYALLVPGCRALDPAPPWLAALPYVEAAYQCPSDGTFVLFVKHTDGLIARAEVPAGPEAQPDCAGLRIMASLRPLRGGQQACRERCDVFNWSFRVDADSPFFEAPERMMHGELRNLYEVVPVGEDRFIVSLSYYSRHSFRFDPSEHPDTIVFLGSEVPAWTSRDGATIRRGGHLYSYYVMIAYPYPQTLAVSVAGDGPAFDRGLRLVEQLVPGDSMTRLRLVTPSPGELEIQDYPPYYPDTVDESVDYQGRGIAIALFAFAGLIGFIGWRRWRSER